MVNAEYAAFKSPKFAIPMNRAREGILSNLVEKGISETEQPKEEVEEEIKQHRKSASTSSQGSLSPSPSKSNVIREFSENIVNLGRRRSTQDLNEKPKSSNSKQLANKKASGKAKFGEGNARDMELNDT